MLDRLLGDRSPLPFLLLLSLRSHLLRQPIPTVLTVIAFAASVALATGVELATRSVGAALRHTTDSMLGSAELEVSAGESGVPERLIEGVRAVPGVASASPVISETFRVDGGPLDGEAIRVVAIDLLYEHEVREYHISREGFTVRDPLRLVASPATVVVAQRLADRLGAGEGDPLALRSAAGRLELRIRGILEGGLANAYGGQVAVMDVFGLQALLGMERRVGHIDVALEPGADRDAVKAALEAVVGDTATVRRSELRAVYADSILSTLNVTVWMCTLVGILLALFLTYSVTSLTVDRRLEELALLRAAGMEGRAVMRLIVADVALLALFGTAVGFAAAVHLSDPLITIFSRTSSYLQHLEVAPVEVQASTVRVALSVGLPVALLASLEPAFRAGNHSPLEVLRGQRVLPRAAAARPGLLALAAAAIAASLVLALGNGFLAPAFRLVSAMALGVPAAGVAVTQIMLLGFRPLQEVLGRIAPRVGYLSGAYLLDRPSETAATLSIWAAVTGGLLALLCSVHSLTVTIDEYWVGLNGEDAVMVFAQDPLLSRDREQIRHGSIERIRTAPGVRAVAPYFDVNTLVEGDEVPLTSLSVDVLAASSGGARSLSDDPEASIAALRRGELLMNEAFARHFGVEVGDEVELATARGLHRFRIGGWGRGYASTTGALHAATDTVLRWFEPTGAEQVALWTDGPREEVLAAVRERTDQALFFRYDDLFRQHTALVVGKFKGLLLVPASLIGALGAIALLNLLFSNVVGRRRELALIRASGGTFANILSMVLLKGLAIGLVGTVVGLALGAAWARVAGDAVALALGYDVIHRIDWRAVETIAIVALGLAGIASLAPAWIVRGRTSRDLSTPG